MALIQRPNLLAVAGLILLDSCCMLVAFLFAVQLTAVEDVLFQEAVVDHVPYFVIFVLVWAAASLDQQLFGRPADEELMAYLFAVTKAVADALVVSTVVMALFTIAGVDREFLLAFGVSALLFVLVVRGAARILVWAIRRQGYTGRHMLLIGANERASHLLDVIRRRDYYGYSVVGLLEDDAERQELLAGYDIPLLGSIEDLERVVREHDIDEICICLPIRSFYSKIQNIANFCEGEGVPVTLVADLFPLRIATNRVMYVEDVPLLSLSAVPEEQARLAMKRALDFVVSSILIVVLMPVFLFTALAIKIESRGPILFAQERVGHNQRRFKMLKFRSMVVNAEDLRKELEELNEADGPVFKIRHDPRITRVGRIIRRTSIDELPQLFNVWVGQMSLVGPRPPLASEVAQYTWDQRRRLSVKPGMTGLWQVSGRSDVNFEEWVEMDLAYIDSWSLLKDFHILLRTFRAVFMGRGAA